MSSRLFHTSRNYKRLLKIVMDDHPTVNVSIDIDEGTIKIIILKINLLKKKSGDYVTFVPSTKDSRS